MNRRLFLLIAFVAAALSLSALDLDSLALAERLNQQRFVFPQEKIHVMTDRGNYLIGDTIWLRAWVVDATTHRPVNASKFVYVELLSPNDSVCARVKIHLDEDSVFKGFMRIPVYLPEGRYQLTAYTTFMQSMGTDYFFRQPVEVMGTLSLVRRIDSRCVRDGEDVDVTLRYVDFSDEPCEFNGFAYMDHKGEWIQRSAQDSVVRFTLKGKNAQMPALLVAFDDYAKFVALPPSQEVKMDFFPEGGYLVPGVENVVTFKMYDAGGLIDNESGELVDAQGTVIAPLRVEHDGMGIVRFAPSTDGRYLARWRNNLDEFVSFTVPQVRFDASVVQVRRSNDGQITVQAVGAQVANALLLMHQGGRQLFASRDSISVCEKDLPPGVVQVLLLDDKWHCLSERLFFARQDALPETIVATDREAYGDREDVMVSVDVSSLGSIVDGADCAVTVIDDKSAMLTEGDIRAGLLLQSDLRGRVHRPGYYFERGDSVDPVEKSRHLDMLMLTQGWRRYDIPRVLKGLIAEPEYPVEVSQIVSGRVLSDWRKNPVADAAVSLIVPRIDFSAVTTTDSLGTFSISLPLLPDSAECILIAQNAKGKKQANLELDAEVFPQTYYSVDPEAKREVPMSIKDEQLWRLEAEGDWRHVMLEELVVRGVKRHRVYSIKSAFELTSDDIAKMNITSVDGALQAVPGTGKGHYSVFVDGEPISEMFFTDAETVNKTTRSTPQSDPNNSKINRLNYGVLNTRTNYDMSEVSIADGVVSMRDVAYIRIERNSIHIFRKPNYNGVWKEASQYVKVTSPLGVQRPAEYFSPRYDHDDCGIEEGGDLRSLLYWNPRVKVDAEGKAVFDFYCNDTHNTNYTILIEGIAPNGAIIRATHSIIKR